MGAAVAVTSMAMAFAVPVPAQAATPVDYKGHVYNAGAKAATADKPQSKVWYNDRAWWSLMVTPAGTVNIYKLNKTDHIWRDTGTVVDTRPSSTGDALWSGSKLHVVSRTVSTSSGTIRHYRFAYSGGVYKKELTTSFGGGGSESATIDQDSEGRLWVTFTRGNVVYVMRSAQDQTTWTAPFRITGADTAVNPDDISAVIAFEGKIGVMWSDQGAQALRFSYHVDGAPDNVWTNETVLLGTGKADDHINIKSLIGDSAGRVYAAVKTNHTVSTDPGIRVMTRGTTGTWTSAATASVADKLTRPQLALDSTNKVVYVLQSSEGGGSVYFKSAPMSNKPAFTASGKGTPFIAFTGAKINNPSTSKDPVNSTTGLVAIAADEYARQYYHGEMSIPGGPDTTAPAAPTVSPASGSYSSAQTVKMSAAESGATIRYTVGAGTAVPGDPTSTSTVYNGPITVSSSQIIKARAYDAAGNGSPVTRRDYTITTPGSTTVTLSPDADTMVMQGTSTTNYGSGPTLAADTQNVSGNASTAVHSYLRFTIPALEEGQSITGARLSLKPSNGTSNGPAVYRTDTTWDESTMTWSSGRPAQSTGVIGNYSTVGTSRLSADLSGITEAGKVSFELAPESTDGADFASKEFATTGDRPQLILTIAGSGS